jgi:hypothetical protein
MVQLTSKNCNLSRRMYWQECGEDFVCTERHLKAPQSQRRWANQMFKFFNRSYPVVFNSVLISDLVRHKHNTKYIMPFSFLIHQSTGSV